MQASAVILAAGASSRFGSAKHAIRIGGRTMLEHVAGAAGEAGLAPMLVVAPTAMAVPNGVERVANDEPERGISRSVQLGLAAVPSTIEGAVLLLGDEPLVRAEAILEVLVAGASGPGVVATRAGERIGPPVFLRRERFEIANAAAGDEGLGALLRAQPDLVLVDAGEPPIDVDTPEQLDAIASPCPGCGARFLASIKGPTHAYMIASPGCWAAFTELIAREFGDPGYGVLHRHAVDAYAVQHPGGDDRRARQSVAVHLVGLCHWLEHGLPADGLTPITRALTTAPREWPWLEPPSSYPMTSIDVLSARDGDEHLHLVREWGVTAWEAWGAHHDQVRQWARDALPRR